MRKRKRILLISNLYPPVIAGGYEIACHDVATKLIEHGYQVRILTSNSSNPAELGPNNVEENIVRKLKLLHDWFHPEFTPNQIDVELFNYSCTKQLIDSFKPDVIYAWNQYFLGGGPLQACNDAHIPVIGHFMDIQLKYYFKPTLLQKVFLKHQDWSSAHTIFPWNNSTFSQIIYASDYIKRSLSAVGVRSKHGLIIYHGLDLDLLPVKTNFSIKQHTVSIVYLGQIAEHKGIFQIRDFLNHFQSTHPQTRIALFVYGIGSKEAIRSLTQSNQITLNYIQGESRTSIWTSLSKYTLGVFPTLTDEPFGISQIELMAAGLPVLTTATGGAGEIALHKKNAVVYTANNQQSFVSQLTWLIKNYLQVAKPIGEYARNTVADLCDSKSMIKKIITIIESA